MRISSWDFVFDTVRADSVHPGAPLDGSKQGGTRIESGGCARGPMVELEGAAMGARHPLPPMRRIERAAARGDPPYMWRVHIGSVIEWSRYFLRKRALKVAPALVDGYFGLRF